MQPFRTFSDWQTPGIPQQKWRCKAREAYTTPYEIEQVWFSWEKTLFLVYSSDDEIHLFAFSCLFACQTTKNCYVTSSHCVFVNKVLLLCFVDRASLYNHLQIKPTRCTYFLIYLFSLLYMFRESICPSSGELTVSIGHWYLSPCMGGCLVCCSSVYT